MLSVVILTVKMLSVIKLSVIIMTVKVLSVVILSVVVLNAMALSVSPPRFLISQCCQNVY